MLYSVVGLLRHSIYMAVERVARVTSITSKSIYVPKTMAGSSSDSSVVRAVETISVSASASESLLIITVSQEC